MSCFPSPEKQPIRPFEGTMELRGLGLTSLRLTSSGHHTCPGTYRASRAHGCVGILVSLPSTKSKHLGRYASELGPGFTPVKPSTRMQGCAQWA